MNLENPFLRRPPLTQSIAERSTYMSRWGSFLINPAAVHLGRRDPSAGLLLYHPEASKTDRRKVGFRMMFNGPDSPLYGSFVAAAVMLLVVFLAPFSTLVSLGIGLLAGFIIWGLLAQISAGVALQVWNTVTLWWPKRLGALTEDSDLGSILDALEALDSTPSQESTPVEYKRRWQEIYNQAAEIKTRRTS